MEVEIRCRPVFSAKEGTMMAPRDTGKRHCRARRSDARDSYAITVFQCEMHWWPTIDLNSERAELHLICA